MERCLDLGERITNVKKDIISFLKFDAGVVLKNNSIYGGKYIIIFGEKDSGSQEYEVLSLCKSSRMNKNYESVEWFETVPREFVRNRLRSGDLNLLGKKEFEEFKTSLYYEYPFSEWELLRRKIKLRRVPSFY